MSDSDQPQHQRKRRIKVLSSSASRRWSPTSSPVIKQIHTKWTSAEKKLLQEYVENAGGKDNVDWKSVAHRLSKASQSRKTGKSCQSKFKRILSASPPFVEVEDKASQTESNLKDHEVQTCVSISESGHVYMLSGRSTTLWELLEDCSPSNTTREQQSPTMTDHSYSQKNELECLLNESDNTYFCNNDKLKFHLALSHSKYLEEFAHTLMSTSQINNIMLHQTAKKLSYKTKFENQGWRCFSINGKGLS